MRCLTNKTKTLLLICGIAIVSLMSGCSLNGLPTPLSTSPSAIRGTGSIVLDVSVPSGAGSRSFNTKGVMTKGTAPTSIKASATPVNGTPGAAPAPVVVKIPMGAQNVKVAIPNLIAGDWQIQLDVLDAVSGPLYRWNTAAPVPVVMNKSAVLAFDNSWYIPAASMKATVVVPAALVNIATSVRVTFAPLPSETPADVASYARTVAILNSKVDPITIDNVNPGYRVVKVELLDASSATVGVIDQVVEILPGRVNAVTLTPSGSGSVGLNDGSGGGITLPSMLAAPIGLSAIYDGTSGEITISWPEVTPASGKKIVSYRLFRCLPNQPDAQRTMLTQSVIPALPVNGNIPPSGTGTLQYVDDIDEIYAPGTYKYWIQVFDSNTDNSGPRASDLSLPFSVAVK